MAQIQAHTPTIRQLLQSRSNLANAPQPGRESIYSDASDSPSLYSRGEFSPPMPTTSAFHQHPYPARMQQHYTRPDTGNSMLTMNSSNSAASGMSGMSMQDGSSMYSTSHALTGLLPAVAEPQLETPRTVRRERSEPRMLERVDEHRPRGGELTNSGSGWFEEETEDEDEESLAGHAPAAPAAAVRLHSVQVQALAQTPIAVHFPTARRPPPPPMAPVPVSFPLRADKSLPAFPRSPRSPKSPRSPPPLPTSPTSSSQSNASPNLGSSTNTASSAPLGSHLSYTGPKMTFLSPAPWEEEEEDAGDLDGPGAGVNGKRGRKMSEDRGSTRGIARAKALIGTGKKEDKEKEGKSELKGLGLISPAKPNSAHTTSSGSSQSGSLTPAAMPSSRHPQPQQARANSHSRPPSPILISPNLAPASVAFVPQPSPSASAAGGGKKPVTHKFSLPRLRHAFQAQSGSSTSTNGSGAKTIPLPSPSAASSTSSLPSPSPLETDFPRTPTSASAQSLHPYSATSPRGKNSAERERERVRSIEEKRNATMPEQGGAGITLISLEQARAMAGVTHRQQSLPTPRLSSSENLSQSATGTGAGTPSQGKDKALKNKRSFLRLFNSPNLGGAAFGRESKDREREGDVPPVPALPAAYLALPSPAMTTSSGSSPQSSPPQATHHQYSQLTPAQLQMQMQNQSQAQAQSIRERRQNRPSPPLEVNVLISRASSSDPTMAATAAGTLASAPASHSNFLTSSTSSGGGLEVPRTPRTPAPPPLTLRPVSTMFSSGFESLLVDDLQASPPKQPQVPPMPPLPKSAPPSTTASPARSAGSGSYRREKSQSQSQSAEEVIAALQAQIATSKRAWQRRVEELEGEVDGLRREVGRLEGMVRNESHVCDRCGGRL